MTDPTSPLPTPADLATEKLRLEVAKLRGEVAGLRRPNYTAWAGVLLAVVGVGFQWINSSITLNRAQLALAEVRHTKDSLDRVNLDSRRLSDSLSVTISNQQAYKDGLGVLIATSQTSLDSLTALGRSLESRVETVRQALSAAEAGVTRLPGGDHGAAAAAQTALRQATASVTEIGEAIQQTTAFTARAADTLQAARADLRGTPIRVALRLSEPLFLSWYRVQTPKLITQLPTRFPRGDTAFTIPYGGTIMVQGRKRDSTLTPLIRVDCTRTATCFTAFP
jgi:hypothetical protein